VTARQDFITALVLIVFSGAAVFESLRMPLFAERGGTLFTAPGLVPGALGIILALCGLILLVRSLKGHHAVETAEADPAAVEEQAGAARRRLILMLVLSLGFAAGLVGLVPFWLATFIFVFLAVALFEMRPQHPPRKRVRLLAVALVEGILVAAGVTYVFQEIFLVRLP
jgi:hypothetical protein